MSTVCAAPGWLHSSRCTRTLVHALVAAVGMAETRDAGMAGPLHTRTHACTVDAYQGHLAGVACSVLLTAVMGARLAKTRKVLNDLGACAPSNSMHHAKGGGVRPRA